MKVTLKLEKLVMFLLGIFAISQLDYAWWWFLVLFLAPDPGMQGYLFGNKPGAFLYNLFHHKGIAMVLWYLGFSIDYQILQLIGIILLSHASFDRMLGYGLQYETGFKLTHLGEIGR